MKKYFACIFIFAVLLLSGFSFSHKDDPYAVVEKQLPGWISFYKKYSPDFRLKEFKKQKTEAITPEVEYELKSLSAEDFEDVFIRKNLLFWSNDSTHFVDIYSYGMEEPECTIFTGDTLTKKIARYGFMGPGGS